MNLTENLRKFVREQYGLAADASDDVIRAEIEKRTKSGELSPQKLNELLGDGQKSTKEQLSDLIKQEVASATAPLAKGLSDLTEALKALKPAQTPTQTNSTQTAQVQKTEAGEFEKSLQEHQTSKENQTKAKVISADKQYDSTRKTLTYPDVKNNGTRHPMAGRPAQFDGRTLYEGSDLDKALCAVYFKWQIQSQLASMHDYPRSWKMNDHDRDLLNYMVNECAWNVDCMDKGGSGAYVHSQKLSESMRKDILDDATSGGTYAVPVVFDDMIVTTPVLFGELFPLVEVVNVPRGRLIDGSTISNPTITSGTAEGTAITPFSTAGFISQMDTTIYPAVSAIRIGLDMESDTPIALGAIITQKFGEKFQEWLDNQIANGDGTTEPQGFFNASGTTVVTSDNGPGGLPTVGDYESMYFTMNKAFRAAKGGRVCFVANDTTYSRSRSIPVGPNDARRVFGMTHQDYMLLNIPYKVQNDISNNNAALVNLGGYRLYRRLGMTIRAEMGGQTLALANERLLVLRARFGGRLTLGGYGVVCTSMQN